MGDRGRIDDGPGDELTCYFSQELCAFTMTACAVILNKWCKYKECYIPRRTKAWCSSGNAFTGYSKNSIGFNPRLNHKDSIGGIWD